ncbi:MAG: 30S ribosomal protein S19 [Candidatus Heimdallarchaeota archaeon]|nr:30S ribosomal protein S19 [Candidatus Heimdallarchaeota archaeon]HUU77715.1 30S ribosomal protein S19 [candidate division Zixibacteria bacterium]
MSQAEVTQAEIKKFQYMGKSFEDVLSMSMDEFIKTLPSRKRRSLTRPSYWTPRRKKLLEDIREQVKGIKEGNKKVKTVKTHLRDMIILPEMVMAKIGVHNGKDFVEFLIRPDMIGHIFGEFALSTKLVRHGSPGMGATKSSLYIPLK